VGNMSGSRLIVFTQADPPPPSGERFTALRLRKVTVRATPTKWGKETLHPILSIPWSHPHQVGNGAPHTGELSAVRATPTRCGEVLRSEPLRDRTSRSTPTRCGENVQIPGNIQYPQRTTPTPVRKPPLLPSAPPCAIRSTPTSVGKPLSHGDAAQ